MTLTSYIFGIGAALTILIVVITMLVRGRLRERHAVWWIVVGTLAIVAGIFPVTLTWAANIIGIEVPLNLVFFVGIATTLLVCLQHSAELTKLESQTRVLAERVAILDLKLREATASTNPPSGGISGDDLGPMTPSS